MKTNYLLLIILLAVTSAVFAQNASRVIAVEDKAFNSYFLNKDNIPKVKGKILNLTKAEISKTKIVYTLVTPFAELQVENSCALNADGSFEIKLEYAFPHQQLFINIDSLFYTSVYTTTDLFIELNAALLKKQNDLLFNGPGVKYLGGDGALNTFTNNHILFKRQQQLQIDSELQRNMPAARTDYNIFIKKYDSLYSALNELDNEYIRQNPSDYAWLIINERQSAYFADLCLAYWGKQMPAELFEKIKIHKAYAISNEGMLFYQYLFVYLNSITQRKRVVDKVPKNLGAATLQTVSMFDSLFSQSKSDFLKLKFSSKDPMEQKQLMEAILPHLTTTWCKSVINDEYNKTAKKLATIDKILSESKPIVFNDNQLGQPIAELPFGARLYKIDAIKADSLLSTLKALFKNKVILIDCWATWCGPCISAFPHSKKLSDECKDLPVEFVYLCTSDGSDMEKWKSKIAEYKLKGTHIFLDKGIESELMNLFSVSGYPSYIFINKDGQYKPGMIKNPSELDKEKLSELIK